MPMRAVLILAARADFEDGFLRMEGGGWTVRNPEPSPCDLVLMAMVPRDEAGEHHARVELFYADGSPLLAETPDGPVQLSFESMFHAHSRVDDPTLSTPLDAGVVFKLGPFPLPEGREFLWRLSIDGQTRDDWVAAFRTTPPAPRQPG
jgi:hypothetical protein